MKKIRPHIRRASRRALVFGAAGGLCLSGAARAEEDAGAPQYETVVVAPPRAREDEAASVSVVTGERVARSGEDLPQVLSELPGTAVTRFGGLGAAAFVSLRGSTWEQVRIYVDGVPINLAAGGDVDLSTIPLGAVERIEVYRAMSPISFGSSALGGIVSITSRTPRTTSARAEIGGGSFGTQMGGLEASWAGRALRVYVGGHALLAEGDFSFRSDNGTAYDPSDDVTLRRKNNELRQGDALLRAVWDLSSRRSLSLSSSLFRRRQGLPGFSIYETEDVSLTTQRALATVRYQGLDDLGAGGALDAQAYGVVSEQRLVDPFSEITLGPADTRDRTRTAGGTLRASHTPAEWLRLAGTADGRFESFRPRDRDAGGASVGMPAERSFGSLGVETNFWWPRADLAVIPSARLEVTRDVRAGRSRFGALEDQKEPQVTALVLPRVGVVGRPSARVTLRANAGRYARVPSFTELYGNTGFLVGNTDLSPEMAWNGDVGGSFHAGGARGGVTADVALFGAMVDDLIQFQQDSYGRAHPKNIGRAQMVGAESSAEARFWRWGRLVAQVTYNDARDTSTSTASRDRQLPLRPRWRSYVRPEVRRVAVGGGVLAGVHADVDVTSGNFLDPANLVAVPRRVLWGGGAALEWPRAGLRLLASAHNLGNSRISDVAGFPLPCRAFYLTLSAYMDMDMDMDVGPGPSSSAITQEPNQ